MKICGLYHKEESHISMNIQYTYNTYLKNTNLPKIVIGISLSYSEFLFGKGSNLDNKWISC